MPGRPSILPSLSRRLRNSRVSNEPDAQLQLTIALSSVNTVDKPVSRAITDGRQKKNLTQKDLATVGNLYCRQVLRLN